MKFENITPFLRFSGDLIVNNNSVKNLIGYDNRIYFCLSGKGNVVIKNKSFTLNENSFILWPAGFVYSYYSNSAMSCITCNFDYTNKSNSFDIPVPPDNISNFHPEQILSESVIFEDNTAFNDIIYLPNAPNIRSLMIELRDAFNIKLKYYRLKTNALMQEILLEALRLGDDSFHIKNKTLVRDVLNYIQQEYKNFPTNDQIGKHFGYHPNYINSLVIKHTGLSLHRYLISCKMSKAMQLLLNTNYSITEIADDIGIDDSRYFSRLFKQWYKQPPSNFRK